MSNVKVNHMKEMTQGPSSAPSVSKREQAALMTGKKVNLFLGKAPNAGLLFSVPQKLVAKYSPTWHHQLVVEHAPVLYLTDISKEPVKYVIEWMVAGGTNSTAKGAVPYPKDDLLNLICLNKLATYLEVGPLKEQTLKSIELYTCHQPLTLMQLDRVFKRTDMSPEIGATIKASVKKWLRGPMKQTWSKETEEHPGAFKAALSVLADVSKEVVQAQKARCKAKIPDGKRKHTTGKATKVVLDNTGKISANANLAEGNGSQHGGPNASKKPIELTRAGEAGRQPSSMPLDSARAIGDNAKASIKCFNCGAADHTRPYCSNPHVFIGKCFVCAEHGHRAAECPSKASKKGRKKATPAQKKNTVSQKLKHTGGAQANVEDAKAEPPPKAGKIVFVKDNERTPAVEASTKFMSHRKISAESSLATNISATSQSSESTKRTSPETTPPPTDPAEHKDKPGKVYRFVTTKVRALNIAADGSVQREIIPDYQAKENSS